MPPETMTGFFSKRFTLSCCREFGFLRHRSGRASFESNVSMPARFRASARSCAFFDLGRQRNGQRQLVETQ